MIHCLPGAMPEKGAVFDAIRPLIHPDSVVFGYSLVRDNVGRSLSSRLAFAALNRFGIINSTRDCAEQLRDELARRFENVFVETHGPIAFFRASSLAA